MQEGLQTGNPMRDKTTALQWQAHLGSLRYQLDWRLLMLTIIMHNSNDLHTPEMIQITDCLDTLQYMV